MYLFIYFIDLMHNHISWTPEAYAASPLLGTPSRHAVYRHGSKTITGLSGEFVSFWFCSFISLSFHWYCMALAFGRFRYFWDVMWLLSQLYSVRISRFISCSTFAAIKSFDTENLFGTVLCSRPTGCPCWSCDRPAIPRRFWTLTAL